MFTWMLIATIWFLLCKNICIKLAKERQNWFPKGLYMWDVFHQRGNYKTNYRFHFKKLSFSALVFVRLLTPVSLLGCRSSWNINIIFLFEFVSWRLRSCYSVSWDINCEELSCLLYLKLVCEGSLLEQNSSNVHRQKGDGNSSGKVGKKDIKPS